MKYVKCLIVSILIGVIGPFIYTVTLIDGSAIQLPKVGMVTVLAMSENEASAYMSKPENLVELSGFKKYFHYTYTDNEYLMYSIAISTLLIFLGACLSVLWCKPHITSP